MKCIIDTNVLISASLFPNSVPAQAFTAAVTFPNDGMICDYTIDEMRRTFNRKFPTKIHVMEEFLAVALIAAEIIPTPSEEENVTDEALINDLKDRPILRAAVHSDADVLITGDHGFLESGITHPLMQSPAEFLSLE